MKKALLFTRLFSFIKSFKKAFLYPCFELLLYDCCKNDTCQNLFLAVISKRVRLASVMVQKGFVPLVR